MTPTKVYVPVSVADSVKEEGTVLIASGKVVITSEKTKLEIVSIHLKEKQLYCFNREELETILTYCFFAGENHGAEKYHLQDHETNKFPSCTRYIKQLLP